MYSLYSLSKHLILIHIFALQHLFICTVSSLNLTNAYLHHKCRVKEGNYKPGSKYEENLNYLIKSVSTNTFEHGFTHISYGEAPNSVTIIFQCRGDSYKSNCRSCYTIAVAELRKRCMRNKGGVIWYDQCFLDISMINRRAPRKNDYKDTFSMQNPNSVSGDTELFNKKTKEFLDKLIIKADKPDVDGSNLIYYAAGEERYGSMKLYAMVQCAKDIVYCKVCLEWNIEELSTCCNGKQGGRVLSTSCNLRYELYPFLRT